MKLYYFSALTCVICFIYWYIAERNTCKCINKNGYSTNNSQTNVNAKQISRRPITDYIGTGVFCIFAVSFFNALLVGVKNWAPTIIMETYHTSPKCSSNNYKYFIFNADRQARAAKQG